MESSNKPTFIEAATGKNAIMWAAGSTIGPSVAKACQQLHNHGIVDYEVQNFGMWNGSLYDESMLRFIFEHEKDAVFARILLGAGVTRAEETLMRCETARGRAELYKAFGNKIGAMNVFPLKGTK